MDRSRRKLLLAGLATAGAAGSWGHAVANVLLPWREGPEHEALRQSELRVAELGALLRRRDPALARQLLDEAHRQAGVRVGALRSQAARTQMARTLTAPNRIASELAQEDFVRCGSYLLTRSEAALASALDATCGTEYGVARSTVGEVMSATPAATTRGEVASG